MDSLLHVTTVLSILLLAMVLISVRRAHIRVEYSVSWLLACGVMLILSRARPVLAMAPNSAVFRISPKFPTAFDLPTSGPERPRRRRA